MLVQVLDILQADSCVYVAVNILPKIQLCKKSQVSEINTNINANEHYWSLMYTTVTHPMCGVTKK